MAPRVQALEERENRCFTIERNWKRHASETNVKYQRVGLTRVEAADGLEYRRFTIGRCPKRRTSENKSSA
jgi:outer membrane protein assembly factor BamB